LNSGARRKVQEWYLHECDFKTLSTGNAESYAILKMADMSFSVQGFKLQIPI